MWFVLLLILQIIAAYGLFRLRTWAWLLAVCVISADFLTRLFGITNLWFNRHPGSSPVLDGIEEQAVVIQSFSLWPGYFRVVLSLVFMIVLLQKPIKNVFNRVQE